MFMVITAIKMRILQIKTMITVTMTITQITQKTPMINMDYMTMITSMWKIIRRS